MSLINLIPQTAAIPGITTINSANNRIIFYLIPFLFNTLVVTASGGKGIEGLHFKKYILRYIVSLMYQGDGIVVHGNKISFCLYKKNDEKETICQE